MGAKQLPASGTSPNKMMHKCRLSQWNKNTQINLFMVHSVRSTCYIMSLGISSLHSRVKTVLGMLIDHFHLPFVPAPYKVTKLLLTQFIIRISNHTHSHTRALRDTDERDKWIIHFISAIDSPLHNVFASSTCGQCFGKREYNTHTHTRKREKKTRKKWRRKKQKCSSFGSDGGYMRQQKW